MLTANTPASFDLVYPLEPESKGPGSASHPLPIDRAIEHARGWGCVDGEGALWTIDSPRLQRYDTNLDLTLELDLGLQPYGERVGSIDCDDQGAMVLIHRGSADGWGATVKQYSKQGLIKQYDMIGKLSGPSSLRAGPSGPLLEFSYSAAEVDGVTYTPPSTANLVTGFYHVVPSNGLPRMVWIQGRLLAIDAEGGFASVTVRESDSYLSTHALDFAYFGPDGTRLSATTVAGRVESLNDFRAATSDGHFIVTGTGWTASTTLDPEDMDASFVAALDRDGKVAWSRVFASPGGVTANAAVAGNRIWLIGSFGEWIETEGSAVLGHRTSIDVDGSASPCCYEAFVAVMDSQGNLQTLAPMGQVDYKRVDLLPAMGTNAFLWGSIAPGEQHVAPYGRNGILPDQFLGTLDLAGQPPRALPPQPEETLPRVTLPVLDGWLSEVKSNYESGATLVLRQGDDLVFVDYPSGRVFPPFRAPLTYENPEFVRVGEEIFTFDAHMSALRHYRLIDQTWTEQPVVFADLRDVHLCAAPLPFSDWLFVACEDNVLAFRRQGDTWMLANRNDQGGGSKLDVDGTTLVVGDYEAKGQREAEGIVRFFHIGASGLEAPELVKPPDALAYAPGNPGSDYKADPPTGKGFGSDVQLEGNWLLVEDEEGSHGFERTDSGWLHRWKHLHWGKGYLVGGALLVASPFEARGSIRRAGAIHIYERANDGWVERQRVVPLQRWNEFGDDVVVLPDRILTSASGSRWTPGSALKPKGTVFEVMRGACP